MAPGDLHLKRDPLRLSDLIEAEHSNVAAMLRTAAAAFPGVLFDLAPTSWMRRACGTLVLTDPLSRA